MKDQPDLILVDGSSYLFRAYHALPPLTNSKGLNTGAAKGVIGMIRKLVADFPRSQVVVIFDAKGPTFRNEMYAEYKANRPPMPEELREQIEPIHAMIGAMGLPLLCIEGVEADDVIGTLATEAAQRDQSVLISTGDKDMAQLVNDRVTLINTMNQAVFDRQGVVDKFGVPPELIIDLLALQGDKVDNIPGVPGVGEKTALALLQGLGGITAIYEQLDQVATLDVRGAKTLGDKLATHREQAELSYALATIRCDCALPVTAETLQRKPADQEALLGWFRELEFKGWTSELLSPAASGAETPTNETANTAADNGEAENFDPVQPGQVAATLAIDTITDESVLEAWLAEIERAPLVAFDTETTSLDYMQARIVGVSLALDADRAAYVPLAHDYPGAPVQLDRDHVLTRLKPWLESPDHRKLGQNLKYDANVLKNHGIELRGIAHDTMLQSYVLDAVGSRHDMDSLALKYLGMRTIRFEEVAGKGAKQLTFNQVSIEQAAPYAAEDAAVTWRLHEVLGEQLSRESHLSALYSDLEMPLVTVLARVERQGALVDKQRLADHSHELSERLVALEAQAHDLAGQPFNLSSPKQLGDILFDKLSLPVIKKTLRVRPRRQRTCWSNWP